MKSGLFSRAALAIAAVVAVLSLSRVSGQVPSLPIRMTAFAVNMSNNLSGANAILEITINSWSTAEERKRLLDVVPKGQNALLDELTDQPVKGRIRIPGWTGSDPNNYRLGWDLHYAWQEPLPEGGTRMVIGTDRHMTMWEVRNQPRTTDYPFTLMQIQMPKEGKGQGKLMPFAMIDFDKKKNVMVLENYGSQPVSLNNITVEKK